MKQYWKAGQIVERPKSLVFNGITYIPPTDEILIEAGYEIKEQEITLEDVLLDEMGTESPRLVENSLNKSAKASRENVAFVKYLSIKSSRLVRSS